MADNKKQKEKKGKGTGTLAGVMATPSTEGLTRVASSINAYDSTFGMVVSSNTHSGEFDSNGAPVLQYPIFQSSADFLQHDSDDSTPKTQSGWGKRTKKVGKGSMYFVSYGSLALEPFFSIFMGTNANQALTAILDVFGSPSDSWARTVGKIFIWGTSAVNLLLDLISVNAEQDTYDIRHEGPKPPKQNYQLKTLLYYINLSFAIVGWGALAQADLDGMNDIFKIKNNEEQGVLMVAMAIFGIAYYYMFSKTNVGKHADGVVGFFKNEEKKKEFLKRCEKEIENLPPELGNKVRRFIERYLRPFSLYFEKYKTPLYVLIARGAATAGIIDDLTTRGMGIDKQNVPRIIATATFGLIGAYVSLMSRSLPAMKPYTNEKWHDITEEEFLEFRRNSTWKDVAKRMASWATVADAIQGSALAGLIWHNLAESMPFWSKALVSGVLPSAIIANSLHVSWLTKTVNQILKDKSEKKEKVEQIEEKTNGTLKIAKENDIKSSVPKEYKYETSTMIKEMKDEAHETPKISKKSQDEKPRITMIAHPDVWEEQSIMEFKKEIGRYANSLDTAFETGDWPKGNPTDDAVIKGISRKVKTSNLVIVATSSIAVKEACDELRGDKQTKASIKIIFESANHKFDWSKEESQNKEIMELVKEDSEVPGLGKHRKQVMHEITQFISKDLMDKIGKALFEEKKDKWWSVPTALTLLNILAGIPRLGSNYFYVDSASTLIANLTGWDQLNPDPTTKILIMIALMLQVVRGDRAVYAGELENSIKHYWAKLAVGLDGEQHQYYIGKLWNAFFKARQEYDPLVLIQVFRQLTGEIAQRAEENALRVEEAKNSKSEEWQVTKFFRSGFSSTKSKSTEKEPLLQPTDRDQPVPVDHTKNGSNGVLVDSAGGTGQDIESAATTPTTTSEVATEAQGKWGTLGRLFTPSSRSTTRSDDDSKAKETSESGYENSEKVENRGGRRPGSGCIVS